jgi:hypothetical protein
MTFPLSFFGYPFVVVNNFNPADLFANGEIGWIHDINNLSTVWSDVGSTTPAAASGPVRSITDISGNDITFTEETNPPTLVQDGSIYYLDVNGTNNKMVSGSVDFSTSDRINVFAGIRKESDATARLLMELGSNINTVNSTFYIAAPELTGASGDFSVNARGTVLSAAVGSGPILAPVSRVLHLSADISEDRLQLNLNGELAGQSTLDRGTGNFANLPVNLFSRNGDSLFFDGRYYRGIAINRDLTNLEVQQVNDWINATTQAYTSNDNGVNLVGYQTIPVTGTTAASYDFNLTGDISTPAAGDYVLVAYTVAANVQTANAGFAAPPGKNPYVSIGSAASNDSFDAGIVVSGKIMDSVPDTTIILNPSTTDSSQMKVAHILVFRGIDSTTPVSSSTFVEGGFVNFVSNGNSPVNPPNADIVRPGSMVVCFAGVTCGIGGTAVFNALGYDQVITQAAQSTVGTVSASQTAAIKYIRNGPSRLFTQSFTRTSGNSGTGDSGVAVTVTLQPPA